jgi:glycosyltransferase involved in cell wall biosynthesis
VLAHHAEGFAIARAARAIVGGDAPLVYVLHTSLGEELPTYLPPSAARLGPVAAGWGHLADRALARGADLAIAPSDRGAALLRVWGARGAVAVLPGVDASELPRFPPEEVRTAWGLPDRPWVVYTGNTDRYQDLDVALDALREVPEAGLLVVTGAEDGWWTEALARRGLTERVVVRVSRDLHDTARALSVAFAAVLPRRRCAGFPIKLLNHLVMGVPTVAAAGATGWEEGVVSVPDGDASAMAAALRALLDDPAAAAAVGQAGRDAVLARGTWEARTRALREAVADIRRQP